MDDTLRHDGAWSDRDGVIYRPALVLTDAEREAIEVACQDLRHTEEAATLRGLLERLK